MRKSRKSYNPRELKIRELWGFYLWSQLGAENEQPSALSTVETRFKALCSTLREAADLNVYANVARLREKVKNITHAATHEEADDEELAEEEEEEEAESSDTIKAELLFWLQLYKYLKLSSRIELDNFVKVFSMKERLFQEQQLIATILNPAAAIALREIVFAHLIDEKKALTDTTLFLAVFQLFVLPLKASELYTLHFASAAPKEKKAHIALKFTKQTLVVEQHNAKNEIILHFEISEPWVVDFFKKVEKKYQLDINRTHVERFYEFLEPLYAQATQGASLRNLKHPYIPLRIFWVAARAAERSYSANVEKTQLRTALLNDMYAANLNAVTQRSSQYYSTVEELNGAFDHFQQYKQHISIKQKPFALSDKPQNSVEAGFSSSQHKKTKFS
jgi:hypothetical protein